MKPEDAAFARPPILNEHGRIFSSGQDGMSRRQYAAIALKVPTSGTKWLDEMILASIRNELAARAMEATVKGVYEKSYINEIAVSAYKIADSMIETGDLTNELNIDPDFKEVSSKDESQL